MPPRKPPSLHLRPERAPDAPAEPGDRLSLLVEMETWGRIERLSRRLTEYHAAELARLLSGAWRLMDHGGPVGVAAQRVLHAVESELMRRALYPWRQHGGRASASRSSRRKRKGADL